MRLNCLVNVMENSLPRAKIGGMGQRAWLANLTNDSNEDTAVNVLMGHCSDGRGNKVAAAMSPGSWSDDVKWMGNLKMSALTCL